MIRIDASGITIDGGTITTSESLLCWPPRQPYLTTAYMPPVTVIERGAIRPTCPYCGNGSAERGNPSKCATCGAPMGSA